MISHADSRPAADAKEGVTLESLQHLRNLFFLGVVALRTHQVLCGIKHGTLSIRLIPTRKQNGLNVATTGLKRRRIHIERDFLHLLTTIPKRALRFPSRPVRVDLNGAYCRTVFFSSSSVCYPVQRGLEPNECEPELARKLVVQFAQNRH